MKTLLSLAAAAVSVTLATPAATAPVVVDFTAYFDPSTTFAQYFGSDVTGTISWDSDQPERWDIPHWTNYGANSATITFTAVESGRTWSAGLLTEIGTNVTGSIGGAYYSYGQELQWSGTTTPAPTSIYDRAPKSVWMQFGTAQPILQDGHMPTSLSLTGFSSFFSVSGGNGAQSMGRFLTLTTETAAVPEPASWAMMLGGFAFVGGTLRLRRRGARFA